MIRDWDDAYANRDHIPGADAYPARWASGAAAFREAAGDRARLDIAYGEDPRQALDLFLPDGPPKGLFVFVHGGYWRAFGKSDWSHLAAGARDRQWAVAVPGYRLAPAARISEIIADAAAAVNAAAALVAGPLILSGHSAGGHLATRMVSAPSPLAPTVLRRVRHVVSISGVHDLRPLLRTRINEDLHLDLASARADSPALLEPAPETRLLCWVGGDERPEFRRQSALLANVWTGLGADCAHVEERGRHHFDVIDGLCDAGSALCQAIFEREMK